MNEDGDGDSGGDRGAGGRFATLDHILSDAVATGVVPGVVIHYADEDQVRFHAARGARQLEPARLPATVDTVYDVASVTKAVVTSVLAMRAVGAGTIGLDDPVTRHLPEFHGEGKAAVTIRHLLCHAGGLAAHRPFYERAPPGPSRRAWILAEAAAEPLVGPPGARAVYTDIGFILLGWILERVAGLRLDVQVNQTMSGTLGLSPTTTFVDVTSDGARARLLAAAPVAATERCPVRGRMLVGEVHDLNAFAMDGVAGHAGLFATASDLARIAAALSAAWRGERPRPVTGAGGSIGPAADRAPGDLVERDVIREFWRPAGLVAGSTWRLGWDGPAPRDSQAGVLLSRAAVGHLGFTGCSLWIDPERARSIVLLANRVHPTVRDDPRFRLFRPAAHDAAIAGTAGRSDAAT